MAEVHGSGSDVVYLVDAPNWNNTPNVSCLKIGITKESLKVRANRGSSFLLGQFYGIVDPGLIMTSYIFKGLRRDMYVEDDINAAASKFAFTWATHRDARVVGDKGHMRLEFLEAPHSKVFVVYISANRMLDAYPSVFGWVEHWAWLQADPVLVGAPIEWADRYDEQLWSKL